MNFVPAVINFLFLICFAFPALAQTTFPSGTVHSQNVKLSASRMADEEGDTFGTAAFHPDLASFTFFYSTDNIVFDIRFHNEINLDYSAPDFAFCAVLLDVDQDSSTGIDYLTGLTPYTFPLGCEYGLQNNYIASPTPGSVYANGMVLLDMITSTILAYYPLHWIDTRHVQFTIPLADLDNDDGHMDGVCITGVVGDLTAVYTDTIPNGGRYSSQPLDITPVPALGAWGMLVMSALLAGSLVFVHRRRSA